MFGVNDNNGNDRLIAIAIGSDPESIPRLFNEISGKLVDLNQLEQLSNEERIDQVNITSGRTINNVINRLVYFIGLQA